MLRLLILLISIITFQFNGYSYLKSLELIYDKEEVYLGNKFTITFDCATNKGITYSSTDPNSRYTFENLSLKANVGIHIYREKEAIRIEVPNDFSENSFKLVCTDIYNKNRVFEFDFQLIEFEKEIKSISIEATSPAVFERSTTQFNISAQLNSGSLINALNANKISFDDFELKVLKGGVLKSPNGLVYVNEARCNDELVLSATLKSNPAIHITKSFAIQKLGIKTVDFSGEGVLGKKQAEQGVPGAHGGLFRGLHGVGAKNGADGMSGAIGEHGTHLKINLRLVKDSCDQDSLIEVQIEDKYGKQLDLFYIDTNKEIAEIQVIGGDGGDGGQGGDGGKGGDAHLYLDSENKTSGNGGNGGDGGNGGNGGDGGDGGSVVVYYEKSVEKYLSKIVLVTAGGRGGRPGNGGQGGRGGNPGNGAQTQGLFGQPGRTGQQGIAGRDGRAGTIAFVLIQAS